MTLPHTDGSGDIFIFQAGGLGDVVLTSQLVSAFKQGYPKKRVILGLDSSLRGLPELFPLPPDEVFPLNIRPFLSSAPSPNLFNALRAVRDRLAPYLVSTFISGAYRPRWFSLFVAAALRPQRAILKPPVPIANPSFLSAALAELGLEEPAVLAPNLPPGLSEPERYRALAQFSMGFGGEETAWSVPPSAGAAALDWLNSGKIEPGRYILCFPFANRSVPIKFWPVERFVGVLNQIAAEEGLSVVLAGSRPEQHDLCAVAAGLHAPVKVFAGTPRDFPLLYGIVAHAKAFLGNDTGISHLAQTLKIPGVAIFGGGHWPAYRPWSPGAIGIRHSLPCYQCDWDCLFEHAFCVDRVPQTIVCEQLRAALHSPPAEPRVVDTSLAGDPTHDLIRRATIVYRRVTHNFDQMANELNRTQAEVKTRGAELERVSQEMALVRAEAHERARALEDASRELSAVRVEAENRARALHEMHDELVSVYQQADERARALEAAKHNQTRLAPKLRDVLRTWTRGTLG
jgi:ADP-heptose:LPS heptosyltransferase